MSAWYQVENIDAIDSPALLFYPERIEENIRRTIAIAGDVSKLRLHVKTHKCAEVVQMQIAAGITKFKCATIAEAEMAATAGAPDVLLAYQPTGARARRFGQLVERLGNKTKFSCIVDSDVAIRDLAQLNNSGASPFLLLLDIDCGQGRTGTPPDERAVDLYKQIASDKRLVAAGLHVYDGHIHSTDLEARRQQCDEAFAPVEALRKKLIAAGMTVPLIVAGGTPTFPFHAKRDASLNVECSPGTNILWDAGYSQNFPDLDFLPAAMVMTRVASEPGANRLCLDLGHKAVASERPHPRVVFPDFIDCKVLMHNEEHLVVEAANGGDFKVGDALYGMPWHICPTVALYQEANVVRSGLISEPTQPWRISARDRRITI